MSVDIDVDIALNQHEDLKQILPEMDSEDSSNPTSLFASAKTVVEAAQSALRHDTAGFDKAKTANAAADLLDAGSHSLKLDESSGYGKYVDKAEDYLRQYGSTTNKPATAAPAVPDAEEGGKKTADTSKEGEEESGGVGGYMKMAEGLMGQSNSSEGSGGVGDIMKMAQGFMK